MAELHTLKRKHCIETFTSGNSLKIPLHKHIKTTVLSQDAIASVAVIFLGTEVLESNLARLQALNNNGKQAKAVRERNRLKFPKWEQG